MSSLIILTICSLFYPIWIRFIGKDAITTGSIMIILLFLVFILKGILSSQISLKFLYIILALMISTAIGMFNVPQELIGPSFRKYVQFFCALLLFFTVTNYYGNLIQKQQYEKIELLLNIIIGMVALQIIIGSILYFIPAFGKFLFLFTTRTEDILATGVTDRNIARLRCLIAGGENFGEIIAVITPLVLYKLIKTKKTIYYICLTLFLAGCVLTVTRSSILLLIAGSLAFVCLNRKIIGISIWFLIVFAATLFSLIIFFYFPDIFDPLIHRFSSMNKNSSSLASAINREEVWNLALLAVKSDINLFGHGMLSIFNNRPVNFHSLYLSVLYQMGIVGASLFFGLLVRILYLLIKSLKKVSGQIERCLLSSCIISYLVFLINETKFEFTRHSSYQQVIWLLFGVYCLVAEYAGQIKINNSGVQSNPYKQI